MSTQHEVFADPASFEPNEGVNESLNWPMGAPDLAVPSITLDGVALSDDPAKQDVWEYLIAHINEFEVAKTIVDFSDANPRALTDNRTPVDLMGLMLLAKVTLKRRAVQYQSAQSAKAAAEVAIQKARAQSRTLVGIVRRVGSHIAATLQALRDNPSLQTTLIVSAFCTAMWLR